MRRRYEDRSRAVIGQPRRGAISTHESSGSRRRPAPRLKELFGLIRLADRLGLDPSIRGPLQHGQGKQQHALERKFAVLG